MLDKSELACFNQSESFRLSGKLDEGMGKGSFEKLTCLKEFFLIILFISTKEFACKAEFYFSNKYEA